MYTYYIFNYLKNDEILCIIFYFCIRIKKLRIDDLINVPLIEYKRIVIFFNIKIMIEVKTKHFSGLTVGYTLTTTLKLLEPTFGAT